MSCSKIGVDDISSLPGNHDRPAWTAVGAVLFGTLLIGSESCHPDFWTIRDMADQLARYIAYFVVKITAPNNQPPDDMKVLYDDTTYPMKQSKS